jgi:hypothetical protein
MTQARISLAPLSTARKSKPALGGHMSGTLYCQATVPYAADTPEPTPMQIWRMNQESGVVLSLSCLSSAFENENGKKKGTAAVKM